MKSLIIKSRKKVFGSLLGRNLSTFKGNGLDFREIREYYYGEDAKRIDWKITAKFQKPYVKEFDEERELNIIICILASGTLNFGTKRLKSELISEITALLGFSAVKNDDNVSLLIYGKQPILYTKPVKTVKGAAYIAEKSFDIDYLKTDWNESFENYLNKFNKSVLFLIGDFYKHPNLMLKHDTFIIWIRDRFEENPYTLGEMDLIDPVSFQLIHTNLNKKSIEKYKTYIKEKDKEFIYTLKKKKIKFTKIYTDEDPFYKLAEMLR